MSKYIPIADLSCKVFVMFVQIASVSDRGSVHDILQKLGHQIMPRVGSDCKAMTALHIGEKLSLVDASV